MNAGSSQTYEQAGVNIHEADEFIDQIQDMIRSTFIPGVVSDIGSFAGFFSIRASDWIEPILVACTDGVGTKLKLAFETNRHETIGIDLVAMSINDLLVCGAKPLLFLDYLATGRLDRRIHSDVLKGIVEGCKQSGCALLGGETAEMPGMYPPGDYDLAGFAVGIVERNQMLGPDRVSPGDLLLGLSSSGLHSNGFSLVRRIFKDRNRFPLDQSLGNLQNSLGDELLTPTRIYTPEISALIKTGALNALAHITGSGIPGNLPRSLPVTCGADVWLDSWERPAIFDLLQKHGNVTQAEMFKTFNMGIGMIAVLNPEMAATAQEKLSSMGLPSSIIGVVTGAPGVRLLSKKPKSDVSIIPSLKPPCHLAILGSGRGSNMESICEAIDRKDLNAIISCVISNNSDAYILEHARNRNIPAYHISRKTHPGKNNLTTQLLNIMKSHQVDLICLAGYMRKIPSEILKAYPNKIINIHPALLPAFGGEGMYGAHVHKAVIQSGAKYSGASVHIVNEEYDMGKIIAQNIVPVFSSDTPEILAERVLATEHDLYWRAIRQLIQESK